ncbi:unnamed protein product [Ostreobium quekettii]|uniref:Uncharacterized protein n=1 Tax=Ostreobium quekettii TaxID=121088 RepID=A0A8S1JDL7_9CHLO|nr:unnamed protein product [Ostreobium quekettii]
MLLVGCGGRLFGIPSAAFGKDLLRLGTRCVVVSCFCTVVSSALPLITFGRPGHVCLQVLRGMFDTFPGMLGECYVLSQAALPSFLTNMCSAVVDVPCPTT